MGDGDRDNVPLPFAQSFVPVPAVHVAFVGVLQVPPLHVNVAEPVAPPVFVPEAVYCCPL